MINATQIRAARALIGWTQAELARQSGISEISIKNIEREATDPRVSTLSALTSALEEAGVVFIPENGGGAGVRLFKEKLVGWKQCTTDFPGNFAGIQNPFEERYVAAGGPQDAALFSRTTTNRAHEIFLASPAAAPFLSSVEGEWTDARNPSLFGWTLLVGVANAYERLGIHAPKLWREVDPGN